MTSIAHYIIHKIEEPTRLLDYVLIFIPELSTRNAAKKAIKKGLLTLDDEQVETGRFVQEGQKIELFEDFKQKKVFGLALNVHYEDDYLAVVYKPAGIGTSGNYFRTLENALAFNIKPSNQKDALQQSLPVHRLDNPTSGLILAAKTKSVRIALGTLFEEGKVHKTYHAITQNKYLGDGVITTPIEGKNAHTVYRTIKTCVTHKFDQLSLLQLSPITGRTHQLRIHLSSMGAPIVGDKLYTNTNKLYHDKGLLLASTGLRFIHPINSQNMDIKIPLPNKFEKFYTRYNKE